MKIKFVLGSYGYEVVLGNISEQVYNKYSQDNDALRDAVTGFEEDPEIKEQIYQYNIYINFLNDYYSDSNPKPISFDESLSKRLFG